MLTIHLATMADVPALQSLNRQQTARLHRCDPRLPEESPLPAWLVLPEGGACWLADLEGEPLAALAVEPEAWEAESPFANVFPRRYLRMRLILGAEADPAVCVPPLLARADAWLDVVPTGGRMLLHPACDAAASAALRAEGFSAYHAIAHQPLTAGVPDDPPGAVEVRPADRFDVNVIADLMMESWQFHAAYQPAIQLSPHIREGCRRQTRSMIGDGLNQVMLVALVRGEIVGFFGIGLSIQDALARPALFTRGYYGDIYEVAVRADQRRQGTGRAMYAAARRWFAARDLEGIFVNYAPTNPLSSRFWPALGFVDAWINWWRP